MSTSCSPVITLPQCVLAVCLWFTAHLHARTLCFQRTHTHDNAQFCTLPPSLPGYGQSTGNGSSSEGRAEPQGEAEYQKARIKQGEHVTLHACACTRGQIDRGHRGAVKEDEGTNAEGRDILVYERTQGDE